MKKFWSYLSVFLTGALTMAIIAAKWIAGDDYSVEVKKIKNKRTSGDNTVTTPVVVNPKEKRRKKKQR